MTDIMDHEKRSALMSRIRGKNTRPELMLRAALRKARVRYQSYRRVGGVRVDLVLPELRVAVLVHGCFWHGCRWHYTPPGDNSIFWKTKLEENRARDRRQVEALRAAGWVPVVVWEHSVLRGARMLVERILRCSKRSSAEDGRIQPHVA